MRILIGAETSGQARRRFRALGHDAWSCDLLPADDGSPYHYQRDLLEILDEGWDMMIAHPPCTYLTVSAAWAFKDGPYHQKVKPGTLVGAARRQAREEALEFVRRLMLAKIPKIAIENPRGSINTFIDTAALGFIRQTVQPYQFGDDASKTTDLWLKGLRPLRPTKYVEPRWVCCGMVLDVDLVGMYRCPNCCGDKRPRPRWANQTDSGQNGLTPTADRWKIRSETYPGIADAMADQWGRQ